MEFDKEYIIGKNLDNPELQTYIKLKFGDNVRYKKPGRIFTMDYRPDRINIHVNADNTIRDISRG